MRTRFAVLLAATALACSVSQKKAATDVALGDAARRRDLFEATLRALDEKPDRVDEFFQLAVEPAHRKTLHRFLADTAGKLDESWLAKLTAAELAAQPASLRRTVEATTDAVAERGRGKESQDAFLAAMVSRREEVAALLASNPDAALALFQAAMKQGAGGAALSRGLGRLVR